MHVTIKEIATLAHISQVLIYNYFGSKEELLGHCVEVVLQKMLDKAKDILTQDIDFKEKIQTALFVCILEMSVALSNTFSQSALSEPALYKLLKENINAKKKELYQEFIEYGKREKEIDEKLSTNMILEYWEAINKSYSVKQIDAKELSTLYHLILYGTVWISRQGIEYLATSDFH